MKQLSKILIIIIIYFANLSAANPQNDIKIREKKDKIYNRVSSKSEIVISILSVEKVASNENNYSIVYYKKGSREFIKRISIGKNNSLKVICDDASGMQNSISTYISLDSINSYCCEFLDRDYMGAKYEDYFEIKVNIQGREKKILIYKQHLRENGDKFKSISELIALLMVEY